MPNFTVFSPELPEGVTLSQYWVLTHMAIHAKESIEDDYENVSSSRVDVYVRNHLDDLDDEDRELLFTETSEHKALSEDRVCDIIFDYLGI